MARVLDPTFLGDVSDLSMGELRERRAECQELEVGLSYHRRMAQGRLDIVGAERRRRLRAQDTDGQALVDIEALDTAGMVSQLSGILADRGRPAGVGRLPQLMAPEASETETDELDAIVGPNELATLDRLDEATLERLVDDLAAYEAGVSARRRELHQRIDTFQAEITRRYRTGEANVDSLLA
jgi:hypothetical protein